MKNINLKYQPFSKVFKHFFVGIFMIITPVFAQAQTKTISGSVHDDKKESLPGVTVSIKGTKEGVITDFTGEYKIKAGPKDQLIFTYMGYETATITVGDRTTINVTLKSTASNLEEIVVIGYGTVKRKDLTGAVGSVSMSDFNKSPVRSFDDALAGRVAGVQVTSGDGRPGGGTNIVIRGNNSVTQSNSPLYVVDGFLIEDPNNNVINPSDIESMEILKDASATAIYGARGANGVIVIQTKKGKEGKPVFSFSSSIGVQELAKKMDMMSTYEFVKYQLELNTLGSPSNPIPPGVTVTPTPPYKLYLTDPNRTLDSYMNEGSTDWQDLVTRTALFKNNNISVSGGTKKFKYAVSGSHTDQDGILLNSNYLRYQGRTNLDYKITDKLKIGANVNYSYLKQTGLDPTQSTSGGSATSNLMVSVWGSRPYSPNTDSPEDELFDPNVNSSTDYRVNPVLNLENTYNVTTTNNISANGYLEYLITKELKLRSSYGYIQNKAEKDEFYNSKTQYGRPGNVNGVNGKMMHNNYKNWLNENTITWDKTINKSKITALGGFTVQEQNSWSYGRSVIQLPNEDLMFDGFDQGTQVQLDPSESVWTMASFLGRVNYTYDSKYMLTASMRADGSSKFPSQNHWGYFPSGALSWKFKEENFLKNNKTLSDGKIRVSYGQTGNNRVGDFDYLSTYYDPSNPLYSTYPFNDSYVVGISASKLGNSDLKWETTEQVDAGIDLGFLDQRIALTADVYQKTTKDLLLKAQLPLSTGFKTAFKNIGSVQNKGLELTLTTKNIVTKDFTWSSSANIAFNRNELTKLAEGQSQIESIIPWDVNWSTVTAYVSKTGQPLGNIYGFEYAGTYKYSDFNTSVNGSGQTVYTIKDGIAGNGNAQRANIQPGDVKYVDQNGDNTIDRNDYTKIGNGNPLNTGGFSNNFTYKNFDLNIFFQWSYGNDILNANRILFDGNQKNQEGLNQFASYEDRWTPENSNSDVFRTKGLNGSTVGYSSYYVEDGSYLRLKTIAIGYNFDKEFVRKMHLKSLRFSLSGQNLYTWTKYSGSDPEVNAYNSALTPGFDFSSYPRSRTIFFATNISF